MEGVLQRRGNRVLSCQLKTQQNRPLVSLGKQDNPSREFLIDTLLHEYYEAEIMINQYSDKKYEKLSKSSDDVRHEWINEQIELFFNKGG